MKIILSMQGAAIALVCVLSQGVYAKEITHRTEPPPVSAAAADAPAVSARDPQGLRDLLEQIGYDATLSKISTGRSEIKMTREGRTSYARFYHCDDSMANCDTLLFLYGIDLPKGATLDDVNKWNADEIVGRAYIDSDLDPWLDWAVVVDGGIPLETFERVLADWKDEIDAFRNFFPG